MSTSGATSRHFEIALRPFRWRWMLLATSRTFMWILFAVAASLLLAMWIDLVWALPVEVRWWVSRGGPIVAACIAVCWFTRLILLQDAEALAVQIDSSKQTGGMVQTGVQLTTRPVTPDGEISAGLAAMAVEQSRKLVGSVSASEVFPAGLVRRPITALLMTIVGAAFVAAVVPAIAKNQLLRFATPTADVPPYTGVVIELEPERDSVLYGDDVLVRAFASGPTPDRMQLVIQSSSGVENVLPLLPAQSQAESDPRSQWRAMLSHVTEPLTLFARSGTSRSRYHKLDVQMTPQILPPTVRITPPAYTGAGTYEGPISDRGIEGLAGTAVQWLVRSNRPLASGVLHIEYRDGTSETIPLSPESTTDPSEFDRDNTWDGSIAGDADQTTPLGGTMALSKPGRFSLSVTDIDGIESRQPVTGNLSILHDERPVVRIVSPRPVSLATPDIVLPVSVDGADDYGITRMSLFRSLNGSPAREVELEVEAGTNRHNARTQLPLNRYGVAAGDEIQLFARIEDNDPTGAKGAESPVTTIRIISMREFQEMMLMRRGAQSIQSKYVTSQRHLEKLAETLRELEEAADAAQRDNASPEELEALSKKLAAAKQAAAEAATVMEKLSGQAMPIDVDQELAARLADQAKQIQAMAAELSQMAAADPNAQKPLSSSQRDSLRRMASSIASQRQQLQEQTIDPLESMQQIFPLVLDQQLFVQIANQQRDLERRISALRSASSEDEDALRRVADLEAEQAQLRQALDKLLDDIESHAAALPDDPEVERLRETAEAFAEAVRASDAISRMASGQEQLLNHQFEVAHDDAKTAADILESFLSQCQGMGDQACKNCELAFNPSAGGANLGNSIEQLLRMMGMKPGSSGMSPGGRPGLGLGWGMGGGYAQRSPGPNNVGMYGTMPAPPQGPSQGRGDRASGGVSVTRGGSPGPGEQTPNDLDATGSSGGHTNQAVPVKYRKKVADYFQQIAEALGE